MAESLIDIVIPNWNGKKMLEICIPSLNKQSVSNFNIIVVDNGSEDGSVEFLGENFPDVHVIQLDFNSGFSNAVNEGIKNSTAPYILLLNNDIEVPQNCLSRLQEKVEMYSDYDFFALKMVDYQDRSLIDGAGDGVMRGGVGYKIGTGEKDKPHYLVDRETFGACAGAALYKRKFFDKVGLFDADFFAYLEDVDLNLRAKRFGLLCMFLGDIAVYHIGSATSGSKINPLTVRLSTRNNLLVIAKNFGVVTIFRFLPAIIIYQIMWFLFCCKKKMVFPYLQGVFQGLVVSLQSFHKRQEILDASEVLEKEFSDMIVKSEKDVVHSIMARRLEHGKTNFMLSCYVRVCL